VLFPIYAGNSLGVAVLLCDAFVSSILKGERISRNEFRMLFELTNHTVGEKAHELAKRLLLRLTDVTATCNKLMSRGLIIRHRDTVDRRIRIIEINTEGYSLVKGLAENLDRMLVENAPNEARRTALVKSARIIVSSYRKDFRYR
jgi:DNA-binding MarR family transcriptional regulator